MSERTSYEPGVPSWVDLASPDTNASATFYGGGATPEATEAPTGREAIGGRRNGQLGVQGRGRQCHLST